MPSSFSLLLTLGLSYATTASALHVGVGAAAPATRRAGAAHMNAQDKIDDLVKTNKVLLFMKGNKLFPQCGFSNTATQILNSITQDYETVDVLADNEIREGVKQYSNWPTIPQCYIDGEFIGGCDLMIEMYQSGELQEMIERVKAEED